MNDAPTKSAAKTEETAAKTPPVPQARRPFEALRHQVDRLFDEFDRDFWAAPFRRSSFDIEPFWRRQLTGASVPAVDIVEKDHAFEVTADLPGLDEKNVEVKLTDGVLIIKGEKQEEKEEKKKDFYLHERHFGAFERSFRVPETVDGDKIEAQFKKGVLTLTLPKKPDARKPEKKIEVRAG